MTGQQLSQVFAALADPTRRDIVARLTRGDATVGELATPYAMSMQAISKHLKVLEDAGLVTRGRDAQRRPVHLNAEVFEVMTTWIDRYRRQAEERYRRLDAVLAELRDDSETTTTQAERNRIMNTAPPSPKRRSRPTQLSRWSASPATSTPRLLRSCGPTPILSCSCAGSDRLDHAPSRLLGRPNRRQLALCGARVTARNSPSAAPSTRSPTTRSCRPSPGRACPTASRWRR